MGEAQIRAAIVGCGGIAQVHMHSISEIPGITLVGACDIKLERAEQMTAEAGGKAFTDLTAMLDEVKPDVLHICTPHYLHTPMAELAAARGIAVFTEKPPVTTTEQWERFRQLAAKIPVGICFQNRYNPETVRMKELLASPEVGAIQGGRAFVTWSRNAPYYTESGWRGSLETEGGGALINQAIHTLDLLVGCIGEPTMAEAKISNHHLKGVIEVEDTMEAYLQFGEIPAVFYATNAYCTDAPILLEIACEKVTIRMEFGRLLLRWKDGRIETEEFEQKAGPGKSYWGAGHKACIDDFYNSLREKRAYQNDIASVRVIVETMLKLYESARAN